jgi:urea transport system substrate-binding protein
MSVKFPLSRLLVLLAAIAWVSATTAASAAGVIKVGVLHSLSGTMAISEEPLKDVILMMIKRQNAKGGLLGKKIVPVVVDPASNWPLFAEKAQELLQKDHVSVIFGCWTSVSRKSVLPVIERDDGLLFYPVQWEGEESSRNIIYTGATPNQQAIPAVKYLMNRLHVKRWALIGTDYVYPRTTNKILKAYLEAHGVKPSNIMVRYTPFGFSDWQSIVSQIKQFGSQGEKTAVVSTINGDANVPFYKELANQHITAEQIPVMAFSVGEQELSGLDTRPLVGDLAAWNYFMSVRTPANMKMIREWHAYIGNDKRVFNDPMEASVIGFRLWVKAVQKVHSTNVDKVIAALPGLEVPNLTGGMAKVLPDHMITKPVLIGEIRPNGQFNVVWRTKHEVPGEAWSSYLPADKHIVADWVHAKCGHYNTVTHVCSGQ